MTVIWTNSRLLASVLLGLVLPMTVVAADGYGTLTGQVVLDGEVPKLRPKIMKGDASAKDAQVCAAQDVPNDELVVNPTNKGIEHVFVYLRTVDKAAIHPSLKQSKEAKVVFDQKNCQFIPHALIVRMDQQAVVKSGDNIQHNTHTYSVLNQGVNFIVGANDREGITLPKFAIKERLPFEVKCDIHPWMRAWWLVVDHPYATVTDADGKFKIENLPAGELKFTLWQERVGYVERELAVTIKANSTTDLKSVKVPLAKVKIDQAEISK